MSREGFDNLVEKAWNSRIEGSAYVLTTKLKLVKMATKLSLKNTNNLKTKIEGANINNMNLGVSI